MDEDGCVGGVCGPGCDGTGSRTHANQHPHHQQHQQHHQQQQQQQQRYQTNQPSCCYAAGHQDDGSGAASCRHHKFRKIKCLWNHLKRYGLRRPAPSVHVSCSGGGCEFGPPSPTVSTCAGAGNRLTVPSPVPPGCRQSRCPSVGCGEGQSDCLLSRRSPARCTGLPASYAFACLVSCFLPARLFLHTFVVVRFLLRLSRLLTPFFRNVLYFYPVSS
uniref:Uncharacterized protein n=1 Tax=Anopheles culicifacies TaxID=139723 RepID=A0A182MB90_9DIPT